MVFINAPTPKANLHFNTFFSCFRVPYPIGLSAASKARMSTAPFFHSLSGLYRFGPYKIYYNIASRGKGYLLGEFYTKHSGCFIADALQCCKHATNIFMKKKNKKYKTIRIIFLIFVCIYIQNFYYACFVLRKWRRILAHSVTNLNIIKDF